MDHLSKDIQNIVGQMTHYVRGGETMTTKYPAAIDTFTTKIDYVSPIIAKDMNDVQDAIVAVETLLTHTVEEVGNISTTRATNVQIVIGATSINIFRDGEQESWVATRDSRDRFSTLTRGESTISITYPPEV